MPRLFTALEIPADVGQSLAMLRGGLPGARWIDPENYHLTLRFIGDIDDALAREIAFMLGKVRRGAFELRIDGLSPFGGRKPRAVVATVRRPSAAGAAGRARTADAADRAGAGGAQIHAACDAGAAARFIEPAGGGLSLGARAFPHRGLPGVALRAVLVARLGRRRPLRGRGELSARRGESFVGFWKTPTPYGRNSTFPITVRSDRLLIASAVFSSG